MAHASQRLAPRSPHSARLLGGAGGPRARRRSRAAEPVSADTVERFVKWLNEPSPPGPRGISRYLYALYLERPDLQLAFQDIGGEDANRFRAWLHGDGIAQEKIPASLLPPLVAPPETGRFAGPDELEPGVNVAGYLSAELGIGEAARLMIDTLDHTGIPSSTLTYTETSSRKQHSFAQRGNGRAPYDVNLICVNADRTPHFARSMGRGFFAGRRTAGYWFWELERFPDVMYPGFAYVDEVWAATRFVTQAIAAANQRPVFTVPVPIPVPSVDPRVSRARFGLPDGVFAFLFMFDFFSIIERKNPIGLVEAFTRAFQPHEGPILVLKTINGHRRLNDLEKLKHAIGDRTDILVMDEYYTAAEKNALLALCDCYVSLHRSEGLGLTMAEAMGLEKPVIATAYSGNLDFMTPENSFLVDYRTSRVPANSEPYPEGTPWADPSLDDAAELMRLVVQNPAEAASRARRGREDILTRHGVAACAPVLRDRIEHLRSTRRETIAVADHSVVPPSTLTAAAPAPVEATLNAARNMLTPGVGLPETAKFRGLRLRLQSALLRALRPYWWQQRELNSLLIEAVRGVNERRAADAEARHAEVLRQLDDLETSLHHRVAQAVLSEGDGRGRLDVLSQRVAEIQGLQQSFSLRVGQRIESADKALDAITSDVSALRGADHNLQERISEVHTRLEAMESSGGELLAGLRTLGDGVQGFQERAAEHLAQLTTHLGEVTVDTRALSHRLYAPPYMSKPDDFQVTEPDGRVILGYDGRSGDGARVYQGFEDVFRGDETFIRDRFKVYLPLLRDRGRLIDVGCGRGEMLELLASEGVAACGIDSDPAMVARCREKGLEVVEADAVTYLRTVPARSLGAIFAAQFIEHLSYAALNEFLSLAHSRLNEGGVLVAETVNPHALEAFKTFWTDLTHHAPIFPEVALTLCRLHGFTSGRILFPHGRGAFDEDRRNCGEYAVVATV